MNMQSQPRLFFLGLDGLEAEAEEMEISIELRAIEADRVAFDFRSLLGRGPISKDDVETAIAITDFAHWAESIGFPLDDEEDRPLTKAKSRGTRRHQTFAVYSSKRNTRAAWKPHRYGDEWFDRRDRKARMVRQQAYHSDTLTPEVKFVGRSPLKAGKGLNAKPWACAAAKRRVVEVEERPLPDYHPVDVAQAKSHPMVYVGGRLRPAAVYQKA